MLQPNVALTNINQQYLGVLFDEGLNDNNYRLRQLVSERCTNCTELELRILE